MPKGRHVERNVDRNVVTLETNLVCNSVRRLQYVFYGSNYHGNQIKIKFRFINNLRNNL